jgi:hypothetical protein
VFNKWYRPSGERKDTNERMQPQGPRLLMVYVLKMCVALFMVTLMKWFLAVAFTLAALMPERIRRIRLW